MNPKPRQFVLQAIDPDHGSPVLEARFGAEDLDQLRALLGETRDDPKLERSYNLGSADLAAINKCFDMSFDAEGREVWLSPFHSVRNVPYLAHTGYELPLLLEGRKQFARFLEHYPPHQHFNEDKFDRYVAEGLLHKEVLVEPFDQPEHLKNGEKIEGFRTVYYTRKGEEWRIPASKVLWEAAAKSGWSLDFERLEGMLYGYEEWQNDWWIDDLRKRRREFGCVRLGCAVGAAQLAWIERTGCRALPATPLILSGASGEDDHALAQQLTNHPDAIALIRLSVKSRPFLGLVNDQPGPEFAVPAERVVDLNRNIVGEIEIVLRRAVEQA